jgi:hypothetical protein
MSSYDRELDCALSELQAWRSTLPADDDTSSRTYDVIANSLQDAKQCSDSEAFYDSLSSLNRFVCDRGPLSSDFIPSFKKLFLRLHERRPRHA